MNLRWAWWRKNTSLFVRQVCAGGKKPHNTNMRYEGNVYAVNPRTNVFGPVCDDNWTLESGHVACRQLGFGPARAVTFESKFGPVPANFAFDEGPMLQNFLRP